MILPIPTGVYSPAKDIVHGGAKYWRKFSLKKLETRIDKATASRRNPYLASFLQWLYGDAILSRMGEVYPVAAFPSGRGQISDIDSVLSTLTIDSDSEEQSLIASSHYRKAMTRAGKTLFNRPTFTMKKIIEGKDEVRVSCGLGTYFEALDTCDSLEWEILEKASALRGDSEREFRRFFQHLKLRRTLHEVVDDPMMDGSCRSAALGVATLIAYRAEGGFRLMLRKRSVSGVSVHGSMTHVIPSFMFQPAVISSPEEEFSIEHNIFREYLEELFNRPEPEDGAMDAKYFYNDPRLTYLRSLLTTGQAQLHVTGIAVNLLNLRPEVCTLLVIDTEDWFTRHGRRDSPKMKFHTNDEWWSVKTFDKASNSVGSIPYKDLLNGTQVPAALRASTMVPPGAAACWLGVDVLQEVLG